MPRTSRPPRRCLYCDRALTTKQLTANGRPRKYCSTTCGNAYWTALRRERSTRIKNGRTHCEICGVKLPANRNAKRRYCSQKCVNAAYRQRQLANQAKRGKTARKHPAARP